MPTLSINPSSTLAPLVGAAMLRRSPKNMPSIRIRQSTDQDLIEILTWLTAQKKDNIHGSFLCNWNLTEKNHKEGKLIVATEQNSDEIIAYQWGGLRFPGILEVRNDKRGIGIGRQIVEYCIEKAISDDVNALMIQCTPESSRPFWEHMGFTVYNEEYRNAYKMLNYDLDVLPEDKDKIAVKIRFYPECRKWKEDTPSLMEFSPNAWRVSDDYIQFEKRLSVFSELPEWNRDPVIEILIDDKVIYLDKAKRASAEDLGVQREYGSIFIDELVIKMENKSQ